MAPEQLALRYDGRPYLAHAWDRVRRRCREIVDVVTPKQAAFDLDVAPSALLHALEERERHHVRASWLLYFIIKDQTGELLRILAEVGGCEVQPARPVTPEEQLARLMGVLEEELGPGVRSMLVSKAERRR